MNIDAIVTGASRGIGKACAETLVKRGAQVLGLARSKPEHAPCPMREVDLGRLDTLADFLKKLAKEHPATNTLICNAGQGHFGCLEEFSFERMRAVIDINFLSHAYLVKAFLPQMKKQGQGAIIFIASEAALQGKQKGSLYCASKFALRGFAQALREECAASGVRVTVINPGMVKTPFFDTLSFAPGDGPNEHILPEDVAETVWHTLRMRPGTTIDEINLSPQTKKIQFKNAL